MNKYQEKLVLATLCGLVITGAAAFVVQPAIATGPTPDRLARTTIVTTPYFQPVGLFAPDMGTRPAS